MNRVWIGLALGLLVGGGGCAGTQKRTTFLSPFHRSASATVAAEPSPIDPFHLPGDTSGSRLARYFPNLSRLTARHAPAAESLRHGPPDLARSDGEASPSTSPASAARLEPTPPVEEKAEFRAVADPEPDPDPAPAPARQGRRNLRSEARQDKAATTAAPPVLGESLVAEVDPKAVAPSSPAVRPPLASPADSQTGISTVGVSIRRKPPALPIDRLTRTRPSSDDKNGDAETQRTRARVEEPRDSAMTPILAVSEPKPPVVDEDESQAGVAPASGDPGSLSGWQGSAPGRRSGGGVPTPATRESEPNLQNREPSPAKATPPEPAVEAAPSTAAPVPPSADPFAEATTAPVEPARVPSGPPPLAAASLDDPDAGGNPALAGRPRMSRDSLPPDLPPVSFPRTYYGQADPTPKRDAETKQARWTWWRRRN